MSSGAVPSRRPAAAIDWSPTWSSDWIASRRTASSVLLMSCNQPAIAAGSNLEFEFGPRDAVSIASAEIADNVFDAADLERMIEGCVEGFLDFHAARTQIVIIGLRKYLS